MPTKKKTAGALKLGDFVKVRHHGNLQGQIVELLGPLGPKGVPIYRVRFRRKPKSMYIELREDQLLPIEPHAASTP